MRTLAILPLPAAMLAAILALGGCNQRDAHNDSTVTANQLPENQGRGSGLGVPDNAPRGSEAAMGTVVSEGEGNPAGAQAYPATGTK